MDLPVFQSITPDVCWVYFLSIDDFFLSLSLKELISCSWSSKVKLEKAFHIVQFTRRFNQVIIRLFNREVHSFLSFSQKVNFWTQGELLRTDILKTRIEILSHFIRIAKVNIITCNAWLIQHFLFRNFSISIISTVVWPLLWLYKVHRSIVCKKLGWFVHEMKFVWIFSSNFVRCRV